MESSCSEGEGVDGGNDDSGEGRERSGTILTFLITTIRIGDITTAVGVGIGATATRKRVDLSLSSADLGINISLRNSLIFNYTCIVSGEGVNFSLVRSVLAINGGVPCSSIEVGLQAQNVRSVVDFLKLISY